MDAKELPATLLTKLRELAEKPFGAENYRVIEPADARAILAALPSDAAQAQLPVAWRYLTPTGWHATTDRSAATRVADHCEVQPLYAAPVAPAAAAPDYAQGLNEALDAAATESEDAYVAQRMSETLAEVWAIIIGDDAQPEDDALNAIERVKKAAQVLRLEVDLYRARRDEAQGAAQ